MPSVGFEPTISVGERPQTHAFDGAATGTNQSIYFIFQVKCEDKNDKVLR
jgi:hypothetical protein